MNEKNNEKSYVVGWQMDWLRQALGLPDNTTKFELVVSVDDVVKVKCEYFPTLTKDEWGMVEKRLSEYKMVKYQETLHRLVNDEVVIIGGPFVRNV